VSTEPNHPSLEPLQACWTAAGAAPPAHASQPSSLPASQRASQLDDGTDDGSDGGIDDGTDAWRAPFRAHFNALRAQRTCTDPWLANLHS
jgi:hypothetical protein